MSKPIIRVGAVSSISNNNDSKGATMTIQSLADFTANSGASLTPATVGGDVKVLPTLQVTASDKPKQRKPSKTSRDPEHKAKMQAGLATWRENRRKANAEVKAKAKEIIAQKQLEALRATEAERIQKIVAKAEARIQEKLEKSLNYKPQVGYLNAVHEAFNFYTKFQVMDPFVHLGTFSANADVYRKYLGELLPRLATISVDGDYKYAIQLKHRKSGKFITLFATLDDRILVCGHEDTVAEDVMSDVANLLCGGVALVRT